MKRSSYIWAALLALILAFSPVTAKAQTPPEAPVIDIINDESVSVDSAAILYAVASVSDGGTLSYQWYETSTGELKDIMAIAYQDKPYLGVLMKEAGTRYFVCMVTNTLNGSEAFTYSNVIAVTATNGMLPVPSPSIEKDPVDLTVEEGTGVNMTLSTSCSAGCRLLITWYVNDKNAYEGATVVGNGAPFKYNAAKTGTFYYYAQVEAVRESDSLFSSPVTTGIYKLEVTAHTHQWSDWTETKEATCSSAGEAERHCLTCEATEKKADVPMTAHTWNDGKVIKEATADTSGLMEFECTKCHTTTQSPIAPLGYTTPAPTDNTLNASGGNGQDGQSGSGASGNGSDGGSNGSFNGDSNSGSGSSAPGTTTKPLDTQKPHKSGNGLLILIICCAVGAVAAIAVTIILTITEKRKGQDDDDDPYAPDDSYDPDDSYGPDDDYDQDDAYDSEGYGSEEYDSGDQYGRGDRYTPAGGYAQPQRDPYYQQPREQVPQYPQYREPQAAQYPQYQEPQASQYPQQAQYRQTPQYPQYQEPQQAYRPQYQEPQRDPYYEEQPMYRQPQQQAYRPQQVPQQRPQVDDPYYPDDRNYRRPANDQGRRYGYSNLGRDQKK